MKKKRNSARGKNFAKTPVYEPVGWYTEHQAADAKTTKERPIVRTTISRWRSGGFINAIDINGSLVLVPKKQLMAFGGVPLGGDELPPMVDDLPDEIEIVLRRVDSDG